MGGTFSKSARPARPGAYFNFEAVAATSVPPAIGSVVAVPFTGSWGPDSQPVQVATFDDFVAVFGRDTGSAGYKAVKQAFQGEGLPGRGGAGTVIAYRMAATAAAKATKTLNNTTPTGALKIDARYKGIKGNDLKLTTQDHVSVTGQNELIVLDGTTVLETFVYADTDLPALAADINASSDWVTATVVTPGVALTNVSSQALTGGLDGATLTSTEWTAMMSGVELSRFAVLAAYGLTDASIVTALKTWATGLNTAGKRFTTVVGGDNSDSITTAVARSTSLNHPDFINVGIGTYLDEELGTLNTAQLTARIAGILASRGESMSLTFARFEGLSIILGPTDAEAVRAFDGGVLVLGRDSNVDAPVRVEAARTTYTTTTDSDKPYLIYRNPKFVATMHSLEMELTEWADSNVIGQLPVNDKTRDAVIAEMAARMRARENASVIQPGWTVAIDTDPPPTVLDEFIALIYGIAFGRSVEQVFNTVLIQ